MNTYYAKHPQAKWVTETFLKHDNICCNLSRFSGVKGPDVAVSQSPCSAPSGNLRQSFCEVPGDTEQHARPPTFARRCELQRRPGRSCPNHHFRHGWGDFFIFISCSIYLTKLKQRKFRPRTGPKLLSSACCVSRIRILQFVPVVHKLQIIL